jgi:multicomponent Na+:H+ antiporter subunit B
MKQNSVLRITTKYIIPPIILFGLYVLFHGEYSPGGGFQAGVIVASAFTLYGVVFGVDLAEQVAPPRLLVALACIGVLVYAGVGILTLLLGGNFLDYATLADDHLAAQQRGIMLVELGVGITVASVMIIIFFAFARRERK